MNQVLYRLGYHCFPTAHKFMIVGVTLNLENNIFIKLIVNSATFGQKTFGQKEIWLTDIWFSYIWPTGIWFKNDQQTFG